VKVNELKKGMLLQCRHGCGFTVRFAGQILGAGRSRYDSGWDKESVAMYLGQRKDMGIKINTGHIDWSDRYVLYKNNILAVDPSDWRWIKPVE
tara:strand:- start:1750 stop:2028 length:279 start_codon:yes stop_codon:yes gene_type:complete